MTFEIAFVFLVVLGALALFAAERFPIDQVAIAIPVVLLVGGIITPAEAVSGLSSEATVTVAAMLVLSLGLVKTGLVGAIARWARTAPLGPSWVRLLLFCLLVGLLSPFLSNTAVVVVFIPVFLALAQAADEPASLYLMPLSYSAILGGTVTLIGTSTNLIVYGMARDRGLEQLGMFSIAPIGLIYLAAGLLYLFTFGRRLLPRRRGVPDLSRKYTVRDFVTELEVGEDSPAAGKTLAELRWGELYDVSVLGILRAQPNREIWAPGARRDIRKGDVLYVRGSSDQLLRLARRERLATAAARSERPEVPHREDTRLAEVLVAPGCPLVGQTLADVRFQQRYGCIVLAVQHHGVPVRGPLARVRFEVGDLLLVHGPARALDGLAGEPGFVLLGEVRPPEARPRAAFAAAIMAGVVVAAGAGLVTILHAALVGVVLMVFTGCVRLEEIYAELDWMVIFLLAGLIPLGVAMDGTGAAEWLARGIAGALAPAGAVPTLAAFYLCTSLLTSIMSNNATAVVMTPVAILTAVDLGMNPYALLVAVMFAASAGFATPFAYQTNAMVYAPGGYRFADYLKVGAPLNLLLLLTATILIPLFWPSP